MPDFFRRVGRVLKSHHNIPCLRVGLVLFCLSATLSADDTPPQLHEFRETHFGVPVELRVYAEGEASANAASRAAYARVDELNALFSDYDADSEASRLSKANGPTKVSPELFFLLEKSLVISEQTDGAFDVTVSPLIKQWRRARRSKVLPTAEQIAAAKALIGYKHLKLDQAHQTVQILNPGLQLDFGGIAKCYMAEEACRVLKEKGCPRSLASIAGDIFAGDPPPDAPGWKIGVAPLDKPDGPPSRYLSLKHMAVSTSGDAFQYVEINGVRYSHIVNPHTGLGLTQRSSVTIIAPHGWMADGYATAVCLLGPEKGMKLIGELKDTEALIAWRDEKEELRTVESAGFKQRVWRE